MTKPLTAWEQVILVTFLRSYRYMDIPGPVRFDRISKPQSIFSFLGRVKTALELSMHWDKLGIDCRRLDPKLHTEWNHSALLRPGICSLNLLGVSGPTGRGLWSRLMDLVIVGKHPWYVKFLDMFIGEFQRVFGIQALPGSISRVSGLLGYLGPDSLSHLTRILEGCPNKGIQKVLQVRACARLSIFPDGAGK